jgi:hypothetical protein
MVSPTTGHCQLSYFLRVSNMVIVVRNKMCIDTSNLSADTILCQNYSLCKRSKDVNHRKFEILEM